MDSHLDRRDFLKAAATAGLGVGIGVTDLQALQPPRVRDAAPATTAAPPIETVRIGFVGVGHQGTNHVRNFSRIPGVEIRAICDLLPEHVARAQKIVTDAGGRLPKAYSGSPREYLRMCQEEELDLVFNATHWEMHAPVLLAAMRSGKHAATEIPMGLTVAELWELVETAESTQKHCVMMENCCYDRTEMMILNMVRQNLFGELLHAECGYLHDLRTLKLTDFYVGNWRVKHSIEKNGDLYPMHGLGPVAQWMDVNRGNQFDYLVSMGGPSRGLNLWAAEHIGPNSPQATQKYALSDVVNTLIRTKAGQTILVTHDTNSPRPYSRKILLQGTKGLIRKYPEQKIHVEGRSPQHQWEDAAKYVSEYDHPIWKTLEEQSRGASHGGMDYIEDFRLIQALRSGQPTDMDVYDGAALSAVIELTGRSIASRSAPVDFPDFTRGAWQRRAPLFVNPAATGV